MVEEIKSVLANLNWPQMCNDREHEYLFLSTMYCFICPICLFDVKKQNIVIHQTFDLNPLHSVVTDFQTSY